jgi:hypothetical protein
MQRSRRIAVEPAVPSGFLPATPPDDALRTAHATATGTDAFTLAELVVTVGVLVLLVLLATQLLKSAATVATLGHKQMDADSQARQLLDRMTIDFAQMVKRSDTDYYLKSSAASPLRRVIQAGNDQIAFYSTVPGYFPTSNYQSPLSVVAYRVNSDSASSAYNKVERMGKGLLLNGAPSPSPTPIVTPTPTGTPVAFTPTVFFPIPLASPLPFPDALIPPPNPLPTPAWPETSSATMGWSDSEVIGPQVFRFEYYYLLKDGSFSDTPWITATGTHNSVSGMQDVAAIVVDIAVIDPKSKVLLSNAQIASLVGQLVDFASGHPPGWLRTQWQNTLDANTTLPRPAISGIRLYERFFYLSPSV